MKYSIIVTIFLSFALCWGNLSGQTIPGKFQKTLPAGLQQQIPSSQVQSGNSIIRNINAFLTKTGVRSNGVNLPQAASQSAPMAANGNSRLSLPPFASIGNDNIRNIVWNRESGTPRFIELNAPAKSTGAVISSVADKAVQAQTFFAENKAILKIEEPGIELQLKESRIDDLNFSHLKFSQTFKGLDVWGREYIVHFDAQGRLVSANGMLEKTPAAIADITGKISYVDAVHIAVSEIEKEGSIVPVPEKAAGILEYKEPVYKKVIWYDGNKIPHLTWMVEVRSGLSRDWFYFVDANDGKILNFYNAVCYDGMATGSAKDLNNVQRTFGTYQVGANYYMLDATQPMYNAAQSTIPDSPVGAIVALDLRNADLSNNASIFYVGSTNNQWNDPASVSAHYNALVTYNYFRTNHNRNSVDDKGMTLYSIVHVTEQGKPMENAYWSGKLMCYGDGGTYFYPLPGGLDVASHEMTHGITQFSANLEYQGQSGALNESMSDAFGTLVDTLDWTLGEHIVKNLTAYPSGALRNMVDPHNGGVAGQQCWQPAAMAEFVKTTDDNGGVHLNSGIPNRAFYLTAKNIGRPKAGKIWYRALTAYLTRSSQFIDARIATITSATDLYGGTSGELASVKSAWDAVGVLDGTAPPPPPGSTLTGKEWILITNTDPGDPNSIYMAKTTVAASTDYFALTTTPVLTRPSVSDVTGVILFIDQNHNLRGMNADPANIQETVLDNSGVWESVSIGPGLTSLALTSKFIDTTIYYFDLTHSISKVFKIATKTFDAVDKKTALYADALSFDPTGRYILFDAYNEVNNASGGKISYWNINILDIQTGNMDVVFPPLAEGLSVGEPSFSKTASTRFAFDYVDTKKSQAYVMAADFNTGDVGTVTGPQSVVGFPSYSGDDKTMVYHTTAVLGGVTHHSTEQMAMKSNFLDGSGSKNGYLVDATYPIWFVIGTRTTGVDKKIEDNPSEFDLLQNYPNPFNPSTTIRYSLPKDAKVKMAIYNLLGNRVAELVNEQQNAGVHEVTWNGSDEKGRQVSSGVYLLTINTGSTVQSKKMILLK